MKSKGSNQLLEENVQGLTSLSERPEKLPVVYQEKKLNSRRKKRKESIVKTSETDSSDVPVESTEILTGAPVATAETTTTTKEPSVSPGRQTLSISDQSPKGSLTQPDRSNSVQLPLSPTITLPVPTVEPRDEPKSTTPALKGMVNGCSTIHVMIQLTTVIAFTL